MNKKTDKLKQILSLIACFLMILGISIQRDTKWLGHELKEKQNTEANFTVADAMRTKSDGSIIINTTTLGKDITGYGGNVPLEISIKDGKVINVKALKNSETPNFFNVAKTLLNKWNGTTLEDASAMKVDAVSGATFSSKAIIGNMQRGLLYAQKSTKKENVWSKMDFSPEAIAGLIVALMAAILPLFIKYRKYRICQQILNITVLGFWCGSFISYSSLVGYMSNGMNVLTLLVPAILLITAFIYPLFGKKSYYCTNVCPFGSLQEVSGKCVKYKLKIKLHTVKRLDTFRQILWALLMLCLWSGMWFDWINYEPFSAFIFQSASWIVIAIAILFVLLSAIIMRPYCRFVCPMGTLFKISQSNK